MSDAASIRTPGVGPIGRADLVPPARPRPEAPRLEATPADPVAERRTTPRRRSRLSAYVALTKPRIIQELLVTTVPTMIVADRGLPSLWLVAATLIGGTLAAGGAHAFNMYVDRDIDGVMERTRHRPIVTGEVSPAAAFWFALALEVVAFAWLWALVNLLSAVLAVAACLFYVFVYSLWLKRSSTSNIVIGGAAGAVPVLVGWAAVTGTLDWAPVVLFGVIFYWTPPHFWALAIRYRDDYAAADVPMLPVRETFARTATRMLLYTLVLWGLTLLFWPLADMGWLYGAVALALGATFTAMVVALRRRPTPALAMRVFSSSITYLTLLFVAIAADQLVRSGS